MLLALLMFMGPFVLGVLVRKTPILRATPYSRVAALAIGASFGCLLLLYRVRFFALWSELLIAIASMLSIVLIMLVMPIDDQSERDKPEGCGLWLLVIGSLVMVSCSAMGRVDYAQKLATKLDGLVSYKYRSRNHNQPAVVVTSPGGASIDFVGVDAVTWDAIHVGQSHLKKPAWSGIGELDGRSVRIVRKNGWLSEFPD